MPAAAPEEASAAQGTAAAAPAASRDPLEDLLEPTPSAASPEPPKPGEIMKPTYFAMHKHTGTEPSLQQNGSLNARDALHCCSLYIPCQTTAQAR